MSRKGGKQKGNAMHAVTIEASTDRVRVPDPWPNPHATKIETVEVSRQLRDDPLARLHSRKQIDDAQYEAGRRWQALHEQAEIVPIGSVDPTNEPVDGGKAIRDPFSDGKRRAMKKIAWLKARLGDDGVALVNDVLLHGRTMVQVAKLRGYEATKGEREYFGRRFRECLDRIATS